MFTNLENEAYRCILKYNKPLSFFMLCVNYEQARICVSVHYMLQLYVYKYNCILSHWYKQ